MGFLKGWSMCEFEGKWMKKWVGGWEKSFPPRQEVGLTYYPSLPTQHKECNMGSQ